MDVFGGDAFLMCGAIIGVLWRVAVPIYFARRGEKRGHSFYLIYLPGLFITPLISIALGGLLPDITSNTETKPSPISTSAESKT